MVNDRNVWVLPFSQTKYLINSYKSKTENTDFASFFIVILPKHRQMNS